MEQNEMRDSPGCLGGYIAMLLMTVVIIGCGERFYANRALKTIKKDYAKIQALLKKHPQLVDSITVVRRDTITITEPAVTITTNEDPINWTSAKVDTVDTAAMGFMAAVDSARKGLPGKTTRAARLLQSKICPRLVKDTVIYVTIRNSVVNERAPIHVGIVAGDGRIMLYTIGGVFRLPENVPLPQPVFEPPQHRLIADIWFWVAVVSWVVTVLVALTVLKRVKQG